MWRIRWGCGLVPTPSTFFGDATVYKLIAVRWGDDVGIVDTMSRHLIFRVSAKAIEAVHWPHVQFVTISDEDFAIIEESSPTWGDVAALVTSSRFAATYAGRVAGPQHTSRFPRMGSVMQKASNVYEMAVRLETTPLGIVALDRATRQAPMWLQAAMSELTKARDNSREV